MLLLLSFFAENKDGTTPLISIYLGTSPSFSSPTLKQQKY